MQTRIFKILNLADAFIFLLGDIHFLIMQKNYFYPSSMEKLFICALITNELLYLLQAYKLELDPMTLVLDWSTDDNGSNLHKK
ncbi:hypothetical protein CUMW_198690, partial [Citrus unshiu]